MAAKSLAGKVALITGGTQGIGRATGIRLASEGAKVIATYGSNTSAAEEFVKTVGSDKAFAVKSDAGSVSASDSLVKDIISQHGRIDILVCNAGVLPMMDLASTTEEAFDRTFAVNVKGPYFLAQKAAAHMKPGSHIIFISTNQCHASTVTPPYLLYNATKGAIEQCVRVINKELGAKGICVNAVAPGPTGTELFYKGKSEQVLNMIKGLSPLKRLGEPEEIAEAIAYLASTKWVMGQVLRVNGGIA